MQRSRNDFLRRWRREPPSRREERPAILLGQHGERPPAMSLLPSRGRHPTALFQRLISAVRGSSEYRHHRPAGRPRRASCFTGRWRPRARFPPRRELTAALTWLRFSHTTTRADAAIDAAAWAPHTPAARRARIRADLVRKLIYMCLIDRNGNAHYHQSCGYVVVMYSQL